MSLMKTVQRHHQEFSLNMSHMHSWVHGAASELPKSIDNCIHVINRKSLEAYTDDFI